MEHELAWTMVPPPQIETSHSETAASAPPPPPCWEQTDLLGFPPPPPAPVTGVEGGAAKATARRAKTSSPEPPATTEPGCGARTEETAAEARWTAPVSLPGFSKAKERSGRPTIERLLILDTETTALHPKDGECIEVGAVLFHVPSRSVLSQVSFLLPCQSNGAEAINGIPAAVSRLEQPWRDALQCFLAMTAAADAILAHNAAFDRQWFGHGALPALDKPWLCSMDDMSWPAGRNLRPAPSVRDLALAYGVPVWAAHRALTDCTYLVQVLQRCEDLEELLRAAQQPRHLYRAQLSYNERHQAKAAGFRWNDPVPGAWSKRLSEQEAASLPFPVHPVQTN